MILINKTKKKHWFKHFYYDFKMFMNRIQIKLQNFYTYKTFAITRFRFKTYLQQQ